MAGGRLKVRNLRFVAGRCFFYTQLHLRGIGRYFDFSEATVLYDAAPLGYFAAVAFFEGYPKMDGIGTFNQCQFGAKTY